MRKGLSVVELLVALMLITIALLGMAGSSAVALRQITDAAARRKATNSALSRLDALSAEGCLRATSGSYNSASGAVSEHWTVKGTGRFARVTDTVIWSSPRGPRTLALESAFAC